MKTAVTTDKHKTAHFNYRESSNLKGSGWKNGIDRAQEERVRLT